MKIIFCGTPEFSIAPLKQLVSTGYDVVAVFTQPDKPKGRGQKEQKTPIKKAAEELKIPVFQPTDMKNEVTQQLIASFNADLMVVVAYGLIIPQAVLDMPEFGCWNIHASILPRWRGAAPIQRAILAGDQSTGISIMQMEAGLDTGPVFRIYRTSIHDCDTSQSLHDRLSEIGAMAIVDCIEALLKKELDQPTVQSSELVTYAHKLEKSEAAINWQQPATDIQRQVRAFNPWPGSHAQIVDEHLKIWRAQVLTSNSNKKAGEICFANKKTLHIQCGEGQLSLLEIQKPGKKRMPVASLMANKAKWYT